MPNYKLKRTNDNLLVLAGIVLLFLLVGGLCASALIGEHYKADSFLSAFLQISIILIIFLLVWSSINRYKKYAPISIVSINTDHLLVVNEKTKKGVTYPLSEIAFVHAEYADAGEGEKGLVIHVISNKGKTILACLYDKQFLNVLQKKIQTIEKLIYAKKVKGVMCKRYFYINPLYWDSPIVKKKIRHGSFFYPLFIFLFLSLVFLIIMGLVI